MTSCKPSRASAVSRHTYDVRSTCDMAFNGVNMRRRADTRRVGCTAALDPLKLGAIAAEPVVKVAILCGAGAICSRQNVLTLQGRRMLSGLIMNVFTPALLLSKLGSSVDAQQALKLWPIAANMIACHAVGLGLGLVQGRLLAMPEQMKPQLVVMNTVGNIGNLPLVLVPSLIANPDIQIPTATQDLGITYVMLGFFCASFIQFPVGYLLLQQQQQQQQQDNTQVSSVQSTAGAPIMEQALATTKASLNQVTASVIQPVQQQQPAHGLPAGVMQPAQQQQSGHGSILATTITQPQPQQQQQQQQVQALSQGVFTPPVVACLLALPVASFPELRDMLFTPEGGLSAVGDCISMLGMPLIPCLFLVLGANLAEGPGAAQVPPTLIISLIISKLIIHPLAGMALVLGSLHAGLLPPETDSLQLLVMMVVWATPTAVLVHSLATMLQAGEDQVSCLLFWEYLASLITLPAFMAVYLHLLQTGQLATHSVM